MVKRMDALTPEQTAALPGWVDKWIKIGLCTDPADRPNFEEAARKCYELSSLKQPEKIVWVDSPRMVVQVGALADYCLEHNIKKGDVAKTARTPACIQYLREDWSHYLGGQFWCAWQAYERFYAEVCGLELPGDLSERGRAYAETAKSACWWWPHEKFIVVSDRPKAILRDAQGRLHSPTGKAIEFRDGWGISLWHGTTIPDEWVADPTSLTPQKALKTNDVEQRRCAVEILGWEKILAILPHRVLDTDRDPMIGSLIEVDLPDAPKTRFIRVKCGTERDFVLPVPNDCKTALQAQAQMYQLSEKDIRSYEVRT